MESIQYEIVREVQCKEYKMIKLELCDNQAWFLTQILDNALDNHCLFLTVDEDDKETFDKEFHKEIVEIRNKLLKIRGIK